MAVWRSEGGQLDNAGFRRIIRELRLPRRTGVAELCAAVGDRLGRPVRLRRAELPPELPSGLVLVTGTAFVVFLDALADPWLQDGIACHELAHLLLGHHLEPLTDPEASRRILPTLEPGTVDRALTRTCYDEDSERAAEALGTALFGRLNPWVPGSGEAVIDRIERALGSG
ncbi:hypothetical protein [Actinoplanes sp. NPDC051494]|uniref:hypothetical protein n=1 Tax=Actinoplanes sp. NPDC051494 TaxID=3363907 RepID=UPI00378ADC60